MREERATAKALVNRRFTRAIFVEGFEPSHQEPIVCPFRTPEARLPYLSDAIPLATDIALPRGARHPAGFEHVNWHSFDPDTFELDRTFIEKSGLALAIYSAERTLIDCFRLAHQEGTDRAHEALRRWVRQRGNQPSSLLELATSFPKAKSRIRQALEVLL